MLSERGGTFHLAEYETLKADAIAASEAGRFPEAASLFSQAHEIARHSADPQIGDIAYCNWAGARIRLGESDGLVAPLGEVLVRSDEPAARRMAAYCISLICELKGEAAYSSPAGRSRRGSSCRTFASSSFTAGSAASGTAMVTRQ